MKHSIGEHLGNYRLVRLLGRGGFAEVYLGEQIYLHTQAAIKVLHVQLADEQVQAFLREAQVLAHLSHPYIVPVLDFAVQGEIPFLVLQYAPRGNLRHLYPKGSRLPLETIIPYVKQLASALQFAHDRHLIHRDIKPENMLIGHDNTVLLSDFGLATVSQSTQQQGLQDVAGTLQYMAPEQLQGQPCYASDQYALGIVVYEWICGAPPFKGTATEITAQQLKASPPSLCEQVEGLTPAVEHVIFKALQKEPHQRFATVEDFATALEEALLADGTSPTIALQSASFVTTLSVGRIQRHPLVGREQEYEQLSQFLLEAEQQSSLLSIQQASSPSSRWLTSPRSSCVLLMGEAGIGKTRLAEELGYEAQQRGWIVVWSRGYTQESMFPYRLWMDIIRNAIQSSFWLPQEMEISSHLLQALTPLLPELASLAHNDPLSLITNGDQTSLPVQEAILAVLTRICRHAPLLVVLDDIHWADTKSIEALSYLARRLTDRPLLLLGTCREQELTQDNLLSKSITTLQRERVMHTLPLAALSSAAVRILVSYLPEPLIQSIQQRAAGNPLFIEELARLFLEDQKETRGERGSTTPFPATIRAVLDERLRNLSQACQKVLRTASILQSSFSFILLQLMEYGRQSSPPDEAGLLTLLEEALQAGILIEEGVGAATSYRFWHPLLMDYLYTSLSTARRGILHQRAANALRQLYAAHEDEAAASITYHLLEAGAEAQHIAFYAERAGHHAYALSAYAHAEHHYQIALLQQEITMRSNERGEPERAIERALQRAFLLECFAECLSFEGKYEEACKHYEQALALHQQYDALAPHYDEAKASQVQALLWCEIGRTWYDRYMFTHALQYHARGEQTLKNAGILSSPAWAMLRLQQGFARWNEGSHAEAYTLAREALLLFRAVIQENKDEPPLPVPSTRLHRTLRGDPVDIGRTQMLLGSIANASGQAMEAIIHLNASLACFEEEKSQREFAIACTNLGNVYLSKAEHDMAQAMFERSLPLAERMGDIPLEGFISLNFGLLAMRIGRLVDAEAWARRGIHLAENANERFCLCVGHAQLARALYEQGKTDEGQILLQQAHMFNQTSLPALCTGFILLVQGQMQLAQTIQEEQLFLEREKDFERKLSQEGQRQLRHIQQTLQQVEDLEGIEAEMRIEARLLLARISLMQGARDSAYQQARQVLREAQQTSLVWLQIRTKRLLGCIFLAYERYEEAFHYFEQTALDCQQLKMRMEYAGILVDWGKAQLQWGTAHKQARMQGWQRLHEAQTLLQECQALFDLQQLEQVQALYETTTLRNMLSERATPV